MPRLRGSIDTPYLPSPISTDIQHRINQIHASLRRIVANLYHLNYQFKETALVFPGVETGTEAAIARIENEIGEVPLALKLFWRQIGSIDLTGSHPHWTGCTYLDQLVVAPPSAAIWELDNFLIDERRRKEAEWPYCIPIAPDIYHKANISGGMFHNVDCPAKSDDPPLNDAPHNPTFLNYVEHSIRWGGFPGLEKSECHMWPLAAFLKET